MSDAEVVDVANLLAQTTVNVQKEITLPKKGLKLNSKEDVKKFCNEIRQCRHMTALRMEGNSVGVEAAEEIGNALKSHPEFERAYWSDMFTGRLKNEIPNALEHLGAGIMTAGAGLVELELSDNAFGPNGLRGLVKFLKSSSCYTLKELKLNNNGLGIFGARMLADCLLECHRGSREAGRPMSLRVFISGRNRLENEGAIALAEAFTAIGTLEEITMLQNFIQHEGISAIAQACLANSKLRLLNLNDNTFTEKGADSVAKVIPRLPLLEVINFGDCLIRTEGATSLVKSLTTGHACLKELILCGNEIGPAAIQDITKCMKNKIHLTTLDLNSNEFGSEGVKLLKSSLEEIQRSQPLGSLSDDEGDRESEDEDDNDSENEEQDNEGVKSADDSADEETNKLLNAMTLSDQAGDSTVTAQANSQGTASLDDFLNDPTPDKYSSLGSNGVSQLLDYIQTSSDDVEKLVHIYVQTALSAMTDDPTKFKDVCRSTDAVLTKLLTGEAANPAYVVNTLLTHLGLMKHEDKKFVPPLAIGPALHVLSHSVTQPYFTKSARTILLTFIDRPHPLLEKSLNEQHGLLTTLYSL